MKKKKPVFRIIFMVIGIILIITIVVLSKLNIISNGTTYAAEVENVTTSYKIDDLEDDKLYVWKDAADKDIDDKRNKFYLCPAGEANVKYDERGVGGCNFTIWISSKADSSIPTLTSKDKLIYVSQKTVPETYDFLRLYENGYSIGITSLIADESDHYYLTYMKTAQDDYKRFINTKSDASELAGYQVERMYLDKVGGKEITSAKITEGGIVKGLKKDEKYVCEFYTGTYYQDYLLTASEHTFTEFEDFTCHGYEFLHSNCIAVDIPDWLKTGYYYINNIGLFRYVGDEDLNRYSGEAYDSNINWNDPIIQYDEYGQVTYDPSREELKEEYAKEYMLNFEEPEEDKVVEEADVSSSSIAVWSYSLEKKQKKFIVEIDLTNIVNGAVATVLVTKPDGSVEAFAENNNAIQVEIKNAEKGAYAFQLKDIPGRSFEVLYPNGETYSGTGNLNDEPEGDDGVGYSE